MPGDAGARRHRLELVDDLSRDEVDVVVAQLDVRVAYSTTTKLVQFGLLDPFNTLRQNKRMKKKKQNLSTKCGKKKVWEEEVGNCLSVQKKKEEEKEEEKKKSTVRNHFTTNLFDWRFEQVQLKVL